MSLDTFNYSNDAEERWPESLNSAVIEVKFNILLQYKFNAIQPCKVKICTIKQINT